MNESQLNIKIQELIQKARIVSFATWRDTHPAEAIQWFQEADNQRRYLTDDDLQRIQRVALSTTRFMSAAQNLRDCARDIVNEAKSEVLNTFPNITQPGGRLYPSERSESCWRDLWHFLRCITYGVAGQHTDYTSTEGLHYLQLLYRELQVPLDAMIVGLEGVKSAGLSRIELKQRKTLEPYFEHLLKRLKQFD
ncbi:MAG: phycobilisome protein [Leptolyngbyaceae cyanobacterium MO_188.B28]|nr:phycobilisome protein [Leptolyngbyaceae cyanobacterium MO_188.B28]